MRQRTTLTALASLIAAGILPVAAVAQAQKAEGPCLQIRDACISAGFTRGGIKDGTGLVADCVVPIVQGTPQPPKASKPLPQIDPQVVADCKAKNPNFGKGGKGGKKQPGASEDL